jgi:hypothetical protein
VQHGLHQAHRRIAGHHGAVRHAAQPGQLALGQLAGGGDAAFAQLASGSPAAVQRLPGLAVAHAAHRRQVGVQVAARAQRAHLVQQARRQHGVKALGDALMQPGAVLRLQRKSGQGGDSACRRR